MIRFNFSSFDALNKLDPLWLQTPDANNFESIAADRATGIDMIECMIVDAEVESKGHRKHLLGIGDWYGSFVDIGIGFARADSSAQYSTYACVLIAKHQ